MDELNCCQISKTHPAHSWRCGLSFIIHPQHPTCKTYLLTCSAIIWPLTPQRSSSTCCLFETFYSPTWHWQKNAYDKHTSAPLSALPPGNYVYAKPPLTTSKAWIPRKMVGHAGPRSYLTDTGKSRISRNRVQVQLAPPRSDSSNSSFYSRAERTLRDQLLPNSITVTTPISQTPARSMEIPLSPAPAYIETSLCCAMLSPMPPLISPVPPSPGLPKSQTVTRSDRVTQRPTRYSD